MRMPAPRSALFLVASAILSSQLWVWLLGLWVVSDTSLLRYAQGAGVAASLAGQLSLLLFSLGTALFVALILRLWLPRSLPGASLIFGTAFFPVFVVSALVNDQGASLVMLTPLWFFLLAFVAGVLLLGRFPRATP